MFLLIARLVRDKGVREFAEAAARVKASFPDAVFRVVGFFEDHPRAITCGEMARWVSGGAIEFPGFADDVRPLLEQCTVYCLPSYHEGTPRTVLEAMATGRAVITTDAPGCRETVQDGENGVLFDVGDAEALAEKLRWILGGGALSLDAAGIRESARERSASYVKERLYTLYAKWPFNPSSPA